MNGRKIDLSKAMPITVGDWKALGTKGITPERLANAAADVAGTTSYCVYVLQKVDPAVTEADLDVLTFTQLISLLETIGAASRAAQPNVPFSTSYTPAPPDTAGTLGTSSS